MRSMRFSGGAFARLFSLALVALLAEAKPSLGQSAVGAAQPSDPKIQVGVGGGVSVPLSDARSSFENGVGGTGFVLLNLLDGGLPALRFSFTYDRFDFKPAVAAAGNGSTSTADPGHSQILGGTAGFELHLLPGPIQPFVTAGVGAFAVQQFIHLANGSSLTATNAKFGVNAGGGVELRFGRFAAFAEGRVQDIFSQTGGLISLNTIQSMPVAFGIMF